MASLITLRGGLTLTTAPLVLTALLTVLYSRMPPVPTFKESTAPNETCSAPPVFRPGYQRRPGFVTPVLDGFRFESDAWIEAVTCTSGVLSVTASGDVAANELPQLTIVQGSTVLAVPSFSQERTVQIRIPGRGRIFLAFLNDYNLADVRVATLRDVTLKAPTCEGFKTVNVPPESAGGWSSEARVATLVRNVPMTVVPCEPGVLTMRVQGRKGNGAYPVVAIRQGDQLVSTVVTDALWKTIEVPLGASPATLTVVNPHGRTIANRNLYIKSLKFTPDMPSR